MAIGSRASARRDSWPWWKTRASGCGRSTACATGRRSTRTRGRTTSGLSCKARKARCSAAFQKVRQAAELGGGEEGKDPDDPDKLLFGDTGLTGMYGRHQTAPLLLASGKRGGASVARQSFPQRAAHLPWRPIPWPARPAACREAFARANPDAPNVRQVLGKVKANFRLVGRRADEASELAVRAGKQGLRYSPFGIGRYG